MIWLVNVVLSVWEKTAVVLLEYNKTRLCICGAILVEQYIVTSQCGIVTSDNDTRWHVYFYYIYI